MWKHTVSFPAGFVLNGFSFSDYSKLIQFGYSSGVKEPKSLLPLGFTGREGQAWLFRTFNTSALVLCPASIADEADRWVGVWP